MAPSHGIHEEIDEDRPRERPVRDGAVHGPAVTVERLVSKGCTDSEKTPAANCAPDDVAAFHRACNRLGVAKGDELRIAGADHADRMVGVEGADGRAVPWAPNRLAARTGGVEVYRAEESSSASATASAGRATTPGSGSSTARPPRTRRCRTAG